MRFKIEKSVQANKWVCTDVENGIVCVFEDRKFNDTQKITMLEDMQPNPLMLAKVMREMAEWLVGNHPEKVF